MIENHSYYNFNGQLMKILVVEDDPLMLKLLEQTLIGEGFEVSANLDFKSAIAQMNIFDPDLIITDIIMPSASGFEIISVVKSSGRPIPVLVISAIDEESTVYESLSLGASDFIIKPFTPVELLERISNLLSQKRKKRKVSKQ